ncbi:hypothetical protein BRADI_3g09215v3 [Brachypodium distachyon]|uniref:Uncharacterized protein n=1 Tax=Brachypodium distachyon TaxID=15368 RepID=A0A2K2CW52_BRADI|nr:hypothetical protein BRADI_3g09215v3 [Brachypodium distachyon]
METSSDSDERWRQESSDAGVTQVIVGSGEEGGALGPSMRSSRARRGGAEKQIGTGGAWPEVEKKARGRGGSRALGILGVAWGLLGVDAVLEEGVAGAGRAKMGEASSDRELQVFGGEDGRSQGVICKDPSVLAPDKWARRAT